MIPHRTYDEVIDNDWDRRKTIILFRDGLSEAEVLDFARWCGRVSSTRLRVRFTRHWVTIFRSV
jgi:hypothetical protein